MAETPAPSVTTITLPIEPREFDTLIFLTVLIAGSALVYAALSRNGSEKEWPEGWTLRALAGFAAVLLPVWVGLLGFVLWALIRLSASFGEVTEEYDLRWSVLALVGLITALGGLVGAPLALIRVFTTERQTKAAEEGLITERITKAVEGLGSEKTVVAPALDPEGNPGRDQNGNMATNERTLPNLEVRIGAIYALERISQDSPRDHVQIMEILCAYIRENAPESLAQEGPITEWTRLTEGTEDGPGMSPSEVAEMKRDLDADRMPDRYAAQRWAATLKPRTDIQVAAQVIGRRTEAQVARERADRRHGEKGYRLDLRGACLQGVDLKGRDLRRVLLQGARMEGADLTEARMEGANLREARMEGANLREARMEGANLWGARMEGANLIEARMEGADLSRARMEEANLREARMEGADLTEARMDGADLGGARMEGANLWEARMEGVDLRETRFDEKTDFTAADVRYAAVKSCDLSRTNVTQTQVSTMFGDGSVALPDGIERPAHWPEADLKTDPYFELSPFHDAWREWQRSQSYTPTRTLMSFEW